MANGGRNVLWRIKAPRRTNSVLCPEMSWEPRRRRQVKLTNEYGPCALSSPSGIFATLKPCIDCDGIGLKRCSWRSGASDQGVPTSAGS